MDQIKPIIAGLKKYYFWICAGILVLVGVGGWYMSTASVDKQTETRVAEIDSSKQSAQTIARTQNHPNEDYEKAMSEWLTRYRKDIEAAWKKKWEAQQKVLKWPAALNVNGKNFADQVNKILKGNPIEALPSDEDGETAKGSELSNSLRELYRDYIKEELPKLADIIDSNWTPTGGAGGGGMSGGGYGLGGGGMDGGSGFGDQGFGIGGSSGAGEGGYDGGYGGGRGIGGNEGPQKIPLVVWNSANQGAIQAKSFDWGGRQNNTPTTKEILYAQENLWVLENLMRIIAATNGDISSPHQATIKQIISIEFGREVKPIRSRVEIPRLAMSMGEGGEGGYGEGGYGPESAMDAEGGYGDMDMMDGGMGYGEGMGGPMGEGALMNPGDYRYVDKDYTKLTVEDMQAATTSPTQENYYLTVAKRLPIRMRFMMDQREIDKLLVECGNANLMVEVRQVRVSPTSDGSGGGGAYGGGGGYGADMGGMNMGGMGMGEEMSGGYGTDGRGGQGSDQNEKFFDVPVEIYGIVYIYNPVHEELLWPEGSRPEEDDPTAESASLMPPADRRR
ncbi:hypothetical protein [Blastopirellula marina]|uniref:Uncharacterized protein n=1 Tax=Blastopirellula marina TaxID=124 RepID=A0A2S8GRN9_9BACT|nr:hypothetical protein [Blastopirellula marina]PQO47095.1 hypothetical protein C5Y93_06270 [Blastopirellula marina]